MCWQCTVMWKWCPAESMWFWLKYLRLLTSYNATNLVQEFQTKGFKMMKSLSYISHSLYWMLYYNTLHWLDIQILFPRYNYAVNETIWEFTHALNCRSLSCRPKFIPICYDKLIWLSARKISLFDISLFWDTM